MRKEVLPASLNLRVSPVNLSCVLTLIVVEINTLIPPTSPERIVSQTPTCSGNSRAGYSPTLFFYFSFDNFPPLILWWVHFISLFFHLVGGRGRDRSYSADNEAAGQSFIF